MSKVAAIFAHPDDEVLGCGATLAKHVAAGDDVKILIVATGLDARGKVSDKQKLNLQEQSRLATGELGASSIEFAGMPDNQLDTVPLLEIVQCIESFLANFPADTIYTHHDGDLNIDHCLVHRAVMTACRPQPNEVLRNVFSCEVNSATEWGLLAQMPFVPTKYVDVTAYLPNKLAALACYEGELRPWPHPRSLKGVEVLAMYRGMHVGFEYAEAFMLIRSTVQ